MGKGFPRTVCASWSQVVPEVPRDPANLKSPQPAQLSLMLPFPASWLGLLPPSPYPISHHLQEAAVEVLRWP